jgi:putative ABC transport system permease protein
LLSPTDDDRRGAPLVAVISDGWWERQFARAPGVVGQTVLVNAVPVTIAGISPRGFVGANVGSIADITLPVAALPSVSPESAPLLGPGNFWLRVLARPATGVSVAQATARLTTLWPRIAEPLIAAHWSAARRTAMSEATFQLSPGGTGWTYLRTMYAQPLLILMAVSGVVLLIACANVASLLLARASARRREIAVRLALGAGRGRIVRQLFIESALLAMLGAACGVLLAWRSGSLLVGMISIGSSPVVFDMTPDWHVLGFTTTVAIATALVFGIAPAVQTTAVAPSPTLKNDAPISPSRSRMLPALVSTQVALSLVLLVGAGLFVRTLRNLHDVDAGFQPRGVLLVDLGARRSALPQELLEEARRVPGVLSASVSTHTPLSGSIWSEPAVPSAQPVPERDNAFFVGAGPRFFETMQIRLLAGREFTDRDTADRPGVAIINRRYAQTFFPNQTSVGQHLSATVRGRPRDLEIVGLVANTSARGLRAAAPPTVYVAYAQLTGDFPTTVEVRAVGSAGQVGAAVRRALQQKLPDAPLEVRPLSAQIDATLFQERMLATLAGGFGALALILTGVGLYGLLAYTVVRRIKEIGIRMALGAQRRQVIVDVLGQAARLVGIGVAVGVPLTYAASHWVQSMLFGLNPTDAATIAGAVILLAMASQIAAYIPAMRASRADPLAALRHE